jgi:hypothetical protein
MKPRTILIASTVIYLMLNAYPWHSQKVFIDYYKSINRGESITNIQARMSRDHRVEFQTISSNSTGQYTLLFYGASDDALITEIMTEDGAVVMKNLRGSTNPPEDVDVSLLWRGYLVQSFLTLLPLGLACTLVARWQKIGAIGRFGYTVVTVIASIYAFIQVAWLALIYAVMIGRIIA